MKRVIIKVNQGRNYLFSTPTKPFQFINGGYMNIIEQVYAATVLWWAVLEKSLTTSPHNEGFYYQNLGEAMLKIKIAQLWWACLIAIAVKNQPPSGGFLMGAICHF